MSNDHIRITPPAIVYNDSTFSLGVDGADDEEHQPLLTAHEDGEHAYLARRENGNDTCYFDACGHCPVYMNIHRLRREIVALIGESSRFLSLRLVFRWDQFPRYLMSYWSENKVQMIRIALIS